MRYCNPAYAAFGRLNVAKGNAVLISTWYPAAHQTLRDPYVGLMHALFSERGFMIVANQLGRCLL